MERKPVLRGFIRDKKNTGKNKKNNKTAAPGLVEFGC